MLTAPLAVIAAASLYFLSVYGTTRPWWRSWEGRALIASSLGWALLGLGLLIDGQWFDVPEWAWVVVAWVAAAGALFKAWLVFSASRPS